MTSKTITIQEDTYNKLVELKRNDESFNDVIERLIKKKQHLRPFFGLLVDDRDNRLLQEIDDAGKVNDEVDLSREVMTEEDNP